MRKADGFMRLRRAMLKNPRVLSFSGNMGMTKSACVAFPRKFQHQLRHSGGYLSRTHEGQNPPKTHDLAQQLVLGNEHAAQRVGIRLCAGATVDDTAAKRSEAARDGLPYPAASDDADRGAVDVCAAHPERLPGAP